MGESLFMYLVLFMFILQLCIKNNTNSRQKTNTVKNITNLQMQLYVYKNTYAHIVLSLYSKCNSYAHSADISVIQSYTCCTFSTYTL